MYGLSPEAQRIERVGKGFLAAGAVPVAAAIIWGSPLGVVGRLATILGGIGLMAYGAKEMVRVNLEATVEEEAPAALAHCMTNYFLNIKPTGAT